MWQMPPFPKCSRGRRIGLVIVGTGHDRLQGGGHLSMQAEDAVLGWADGEPLTTTELLAASARYWEALGSSDADVG